MAHRAHPLDERRLGFQEDELVVAVPGNGHRKGGRVEGNESLRAKRKKIKLLKRSLPCLLALFGLDCGEKT